MKNRLCGWLGPVLLSLSFAATAEFHTYVIDELYSNADGTVQYLVMRESMGSNGENLWFGNALRATRAGTTKTFVFPTNLPGGECGDYGCTLAQTAFTRAHCDTRLRVAGSYRAGLHHPERVFCHRRRHRQLRGRRPGHLYVDPHGRDQRGDPWRRRRAQRRDQLRSTASVSGAVLNFSGLWYKAPAESESGWGINFAHQGDAIFASWFTYDMTGKGWWLVMTANNSGGNTFTGTLLEATGPAFDAVPFPPLGSPGGIAGSAVGTGTLAFTDANNGTFAYTVNGTSQVKAEGV